MKNGGQTKPFFHAQAALEVFSSFKCAGSFFHFASRIPNEV